MKHFIAIKVGTLRKRITICWALSVEGFGFIAVHVAFCRKSGHVYIITTVFEWSTEMKSAKQYVCITVEKDIKPFESMSKYQLKSPVGR